MRTTRRLPDAVLLALVASVASVAFVVVTTTSCSSNDGDGPELPRPDADGGADALPDAARDDVTDAGVADVVVVDGAPLPIECKAPPCAIALSTTATASVEEGYCARLDDGTVACWGANTEGQLGSSEPIGQSSVPLRVAGLSKITHLDHTCAVDVDGSVFCWGRGPFLQSEASATTVQSTPVRLPLPGPATKVAVSNLANVGCAILRDRSVVCWGSNQGQQLGEATPPVENNGPPRRIELASGAKDIAVGGAVLVIDDVGTLKSWGAAIGVGRPISTASDPWPTKVALTPVAMIDTVASEVCAVVNGVGWCWGSRDAPSSEPGDGYARALPIAVDTPEPITRIATSRSVSVREELNSYLDRRRWCATSVTGRVFCWGLNNAGQAGSGTKQFALEPVEVVGLPAPAAEVKVMPYSTCAILTNGKVYCWGSNLYGQLGAGRPKGTALQPVEVKLP